MIRCLAARAAYFWHARRPAGRETADLVSYAILGVLAKHGPSTSLEVARILKRRPAGTLMDLAVMERAWGSVVSERTDESAAVLPRYRLAGTNAPVRTPASQGAFWDDLNHRLEDPKFREAYDAQVNAEDGTP